MQNLAFWKNWLPVYRHMLMVCLAVCLLAGAWLWISSFIAPTPAVKAEHVQDIENISLPVHSFALGSHTISVAADTYVVWEHILGGELVPNITGSWIFLFLFMVSLILLISLLTTLSRFWFFTGLGLLALVVISLRLDTLDIARTSGKQLPVIIFALYALGSYYYQFVQTTASFSNRVVLFLGITVFIALIIHFFSGIAEPFHWISSHAILPGLIFFVILIFTVAHEILAAFITLLTQGRQPTNSLRHFLFVSTIYMVNLSLIYADKKHMIDWSFLPFSYFLLATLSIVLGFWGFRQREVLYANILPANPFGVYLYLALATISFSTMALVVATANDPAIHFVQDMILYSHLGYGLIFMVYVIVNFLTLLGQNKPVYLVMYKPATMPYFTFRFAGLIATFTFFAYSNWKVSAHQVSAAIDNGLGDYYLRLDSTRSAESYYQRALLYANRNYHAHYALSQIQAGRWEFEKEKTELDRLAHSRPFDLAYLNHARLFEVATKWPVAKQILEDGLKDFPKNGMLQNALGLVYVKLENRDSAVLLINQARSTTTSRASAETNLLGLSAHFRVTLPVDSLVSLLGDDNPGVLTNALALAAFQKKNLSIQVDLGKDTIYSLYSATAVNNFLIQRLGEMDTARVSHFMALARRPVNERFKNILIAAAAQTYYRAGQINKAIRLMHEAAFIGQLPQYYVVLGQWSLEQGAPETAINFLDQALNKNYKDANLLQAIALTEKGDLPSARHAWDSLSKSPNHAWQQEAIRMKKILSASSAEALLFTATDQYEFSRLRFKLDQQADFEKFVNTISDGPVKAHALVDRASKFEEADEAEAAIHNLTLANGLRFTDKHLLETGKHIHLRCLVALGKWKEAAQQIGTEITFEGTWQLEKLLLETLLAEQSGKPDVNAFARLANENPFFEDAVVEAARFYAEQDNGGMKAYGVLVDALDRNPMSIKLLKAHFVQAARLAYDDEAKSSLDKLHQLVSSEAFVVFARQYPDIFELSRN